MLCIRLSCFSHDFWVNILTCWVETFQQNVRNMWKLGYETFVVLIVKYSAKKTHQDKIRKIWNIEQDLSELSHVPQDVYTFLSYKCCNIWHQGQRQAPLSCFEHATADLSHTLSGVIYSKCETSEVAQSMSNCLIIGHVSVQICVWFIRLSTMT